MSLLNPIYELIARIIVVIHAGLAPIFGQGSGWAWGLSIVFLTILMRLALFPLFVKQIKTQRAMQVLQPKMKELQTKYKGDRETLNAEMMKLYKEHGANPLAGCLPLLLQMPVFFALFHVLSRIRPDAQGNYKAVSGLSADLVESAAHAKIFGAPIAASFKSGNDLLTTLSANPATVKVVAAIMVVLMGASTFWTQRQLMTRTAASGGTAVTSQQKILLYVLPFTFLFAGFNFPIGVLLYWLTTNLWSMGQQHFVIAKMGAYGPVDAAEPTSKSRRWSLPAWARGRKADGAATAAADADDAATPDLTTPKSAAAPPPSPPGGVTTSGALPPRPPKSNPGGPRRQGRRPPNSSNRRKGSRRGGRH